MLDNSGGEAVGDALQWPIAKYCMKYNSMLDWGSFSKCKILLFSKLSKCRKSLGRRFGLLGYDQILIEISSVCNVRCVWCWMYNSGRKDMGMMPFDDFKRIIDLSAGFLIRKRTPLILQHRGESLLHPDFYEMLDYAYEKGIRIGGIHTHFSVQLDIEKLIKSPLPFVLINMGGITRDTHENVMRGSNFNLVVKNLQSVLKEIRRSGANKEVFLKVNPTRSNLSELAKVSDFFKDLGGNPANVRIGRTAFYLPREASRKETEDYFASIVSEEMEKYLAFTYDHEKNIFPKWYGCAMAMPAVLWDGRVTLCYQDQLGVMNFGNAFTESLKDILNSGKYKKAEKLGKQRKLAICEGCNC